MPSSSSGPTPAPGPGRRTRASAAPPAPADVSASLSAFAGAGRGDGRARTVAAAGAGSASPVDRPSSAHARLVEVELASSSSKRCVDHGFDLVSGSALSESSSKSACAFPVISNATFVFASSASSRSFWRRSRSNSTCSGRALRRPRLRRQRVDARRRRGPCATPTMCERVQALPAQQRARSPPGSAARRTRRRSPPCTRR